MSTTEEIIEETIVKFEQVVVPCTDCIHAEICKYKFKCGVYASRINEEIANLNEFLAVPEESAMSDKLFMLSIDSTEGLPNINMSCKFFSTNEPESEPEPTDPEAEPVDPEPQPEEVPGGTEEPEATE